MILYSFLWNYVRQISRIKYWQVCQKLFVGLTFLKFCEKKLDWFQSGNILPSQTFIESYSLSKQCSQCVSDNVNYSWLILNIFPLHTHTHTQTLSLSLSYTKTYAYTHTPTPSLSLAMSVFVELFPSSICKKAGMYSLADKLKRDWGKNSMKNMK